MAFSLASAPGIGKKELIIVITGNLTEKVGEALLQGVFNRIAVERKLRHLSADGIDISRMRVTYGDHGVTSVKVEIGSAIGGVDIVSLAAHGLYVV